LFPQSLNDATTIVATAAMTPRLAASSFRLTRSAVPKILADVDREKKRGPGFHS